MGEARTIRPVEAYGELRLPVVLGSRQHLAMGVKPGDRIAIMSENRMEWAIADYASLCAGAATVPIYPTLSGVQVEALLRDSEPVAIFASTPREFGSIPLGWTDRDKVRTPP